MGEGLWSWILGVLTLEPNGGGFLDIRECSPWSLMVVGRQGSWMFGVFTLEPNDGEGSLSRCPDPK